MKSAGKDRSNSARPLRRSGWYAHWAYGMAPESYQVSMTSGTRRASWWHWGHGSVTSSMAGRWGSTPETSRPARADNSRSEPTTVTWRREQRHTGSGVPQYRSRDSAQSTLFSSQSPYRPCLMCSGYQFTDSLISRRRSFRAVVRMYQDVRATYSSGVSHRQHSGYVCSYVSAFRRRSRDSRSAMIFGSASLTNRPRTNPTGVWSVNRPSSSMGRYVGHPSRRPIARSSEPNPGATWMIPVPSSIDTKSPAATTRWVFPFTFSYSGLYRTPPSSVRHSARITSPPEEGTRT